MVRYSGRRTWVTSSLDGTLHGFGKLTMRNWAHHNNSRQEIPTLTITEEGNKWTVRRNVKLVLQELLKLNTSWSFHRSSTLKQRLRLYEVPDFY